jgi:hypothetical protein
MKHLPGLLMMLLPSLVFAQKGTLSVGTRTTVSMFNDDNAIGKGLGGQARYQFSDRLNTEWYADFITSKNGIYTFRNDYHIGWSMMFYPKNNYQFKKILQPYFIAGHCFDYSKVTAQDDPSNSAGRFSIAVQTGVGMHINITPKFDCSLTSQYMLHLGKEIVTGIDKGDVVISRQNFSHLDGHLLFALSFNYKLWQL